MNDLFDFLQLSTVVCCWHGSWCILNNTDGTWWTN